jgi:hypothetical protein
MHDKSTSSIARQLAIAGLICHVGPLFGLIATLWAYFGLAADLGTKGDIAHSARAITFSIFSAMVFTSIGLFCRIIGMGLLMVSVLSMRYRARWLFGWLIALSLWCLLGFPYLTVIGAIALVALIAGRDQFLKEKNT